VAICVIGAFLTIFMRPDRPFIPPREVNAVEYKTQ